MDKQKIQQQSNIEPVAEGKERKKPTRKHIDGQTDQKCHTIIFRIVLDFLMPHFVFFPENL